MEHNQKRRSTNQMFASFKLGSSEFALPITSLQEVVNVPEKISSVPLAPTYLTGLFNLRGSVIPVVDVSKILNIETQADTSSCKIAIIQCQNTRIGLLFDSTSEILNVEENHISLFENLENSNKIVLGAIKLNGGDRIIEIIDSVKIVKIENIPLILENSKNKTIETQKKSKRQQCITFISNKSKFAFDIAAISEIIRVPEIQRQSSEPDYGNGVVNVRGSIIPLINFCKFLMVADEPQTEKEKQRIIIMKQDKVHFGFLVDSVENITSYYEEDLLPIPLFQQQKMEIFKGLLSHDQMGDLIFLNDKRILNNDEVQKLTHGCNTFYNQGSLSQNSSNIKSKTGVRVPYLSFKLENLFSSNIKEIDEIAVIPQDIMRPPGYPEYVSGVLKMRGEIVTVIDLRKYYGLSEASDCSNSRILIVKGKTSKIGLIVDSVESIENVDENHKLKIPSIAAAPTSKSLQTAIKEIVEMSDSKGQKKTFMVMDVSGLVEKIESLFTIAS